MNIIAAGPVQDALVEEADIARVSADSVISARGTMLVAHNNNGLEHLSIVWRKH